MRNSKSFDWLRYPEADAFIARCFNRFVSAMPEVHAFAQAMSTRTGSRLIDWLDHLVLTDVDHLRGQLADLGFEPEEVPAHPGDEVYYHTRALFPRLLLRTEMREVAGTTVAAAMRVEAINQFLMANQ
jgi:hypothetical protein